MTEVPTTDRSVKVGERPTVVRTTSGGRVMDTGSCRRCLVILGRSRGPCRPWKSCYPYQHGPLSHYPSWDSRSVLRLGGDLGVVGGINEKVNLLIRLSWGTRTHARTRRHTHTYTQNLLPRRRVLTKTFVDDYSYKKKNLNTLVGSFHNPIPTR